MKQKLFTFIIAVILCFGARAQSISPDLNADYCPSIENTFTVTLPGIGYTGINVIGWTHTGADMQ